MTILTPPERPVPGDVVQFVGPGRAPLSSVEIGSKGVVDSTFYAEDDEALVCFAASAYREERAGDIDFVSCSGGPVPYIKFADLEYAGTVERTFWRWLDRPRAGGGVDFILTVNLWTWKGQP